MHRLWYAAVLCHAHLFFHIIYIGKFNRYYETHIYIKYTFTGEFSFLESR